MIVQSLTPVIVPSIAQSVINQNSRELERGMGDCGCSCKGAPGGCRGGMSGLSGLLDDAAPFTSLVLHLGAAWLAYQLFRLVFVQKNTEGDNRYRVRRKAVKAARQVGADAVSKAKAENSLFF